mmetsp:Transcript_10442/g.25803  ORF Transcript_10442/g.25803 Transcript_10442/m.25803 type:complete len:202 (-) Transcript_10442:28-633(-)
MLPAKTPPTKCTTPPNRGLPSSGLRLSFGRQTSHPPALIHSTSTPFVLPSPMPPAVLLPPPLRLRLLLPADSDDASSDLPPSLPFSTPISRAPDLPKLFHSSESYQSSSGLRACPDMHRGGTRRLLRLEAKLERGAGLGRSDAAVRVLLGANSDAWQRPAGRKEDPAGAETKAWAADAHNTPTIKVIKGDRGILHPATIFP